jgi:hypothetical protein
VSLKPLVAVVMSFRITWGNTHRGSQQVNLIWLLLEAPWSELIARALLPLRPSEYPPDDRDSSSRTGWDAYARMMQGKARFRMVLATEDGAL